LEKANCEKKLAWHREYRLELDTESGTLISNRCCLNTPLEL
jgi:hypothetical protein